MHFWLNYIIFGLLVLGNIETILADEIPVIVFPENRYGEHFSADLVGGTQQNLTNLTLCLKVEYPKYT